MRPFLSHEQERAARERADISEAGMWICIAGLLLVAAFCFFMIATSAR